MDTSRLLELIKMDETKRKIVEKDLTEICNSPYTIHSLVSECSKIYIKNKISLSEFYDILKGVKSDNPFLNLLYESFSDKERIENFIKNNEIIIIDSNPSFEEEKTDSIENQ